jgi:hypothetical protein
MKKVYIQPKIELTVKGEKEIKEFLFKFCKPDSIVIQTVGRDKEKIQLQDLFTQK